MLGNRKNKEDSWDFYIFDIVYCPKTYELNRKNWLNSSLKRNDLEFFGGKTPSCHQGGFISVFIGGPQLNYTYGNPVFVTQIPWLLSIHNVSSYNA